MIRRDLKLLMPRTGNFSVCLPRNEALGDPTDLGQFCVSRSSNADLLFVLRILSSVATPRNERHAVIVYVERAVLTAEALFVQALQHIITKVTFGRTVELSRDEFVRHTGDGSEEVEDAISGGHCYGRMNPQ